MNKVVTAMKAHTVYDMDIPVAWVHPATEESVTSVFDGERSDWMWVRLPNGDLILGVYPQSETYFEVEVEASYPGDSDG